MADVESYCLEENHNFATKEMFNLRIAEEANLWCIKVKVERSDPTNLIVVGYNFYVSGSYSESAGWTAHIVVCREGDNLLKIPPNQRIDWINDDTASCHPREILSSDASH